MNPQKRKEQIRTLWQKCFDDREDFVAFYFDKVYKDENAMSLEKEGRVVSALQMIPYTMNWCGTEITVAYISGACTDPEQRGKGLMGELLRQSFREMRRRKYDITALIPATASLFDYYRAYGYTEVFDYSLRTFECPEISSGIKEMPFLSLDKDVGKEWFIYFDQQIKKRPSCIWHTEEDFRNNIQDFTMAEGLVLGMRGADGQPAGMAFITATEEEALIKEMVYDNEKIKEQLLRKAAASFHTGKVIYKTPALPPAAQRYGMAMILNKEKMIPQWLHAHPDSTRTAETLNRMDQTSLTQLLFNYEQREAYMSLMMD
ncbi:GNAT family N-acetyltransferase [Parabacteroides sp. PF5-6]|uniref:GNAT family N-acetyltransferase n=1 Tax=Parabacteroides sp. PF5-6 TaxID=1742403 RepID=UPI00240766FA|nr:GNAT family N-acetyltransferase [Parabacteroides sp. PF5-6]MDF9829070.1 putative acetyltransferase [Parabacteroides sp. PF5-6]